MTLNTQLNNLWEENRELKERLETVTRERDELAAQLAEHKLKIGTLENVTLRAVARERNDAISQLADEKAAREKAEAACCEMKELLRFCETIGDASPEILRNNFVCPVCGCYGPDSSNMVHLSNCKLKLAVYDTTCGQSILEERRALAESLRKLHDYQNGPPLVKYAKAWGEAMEEAEKILAKVEPKIAITP